MDKKYEVTLENYYSLIRHVLPTNLWMPLEKDISHECLLFISDGKSKIRMRFDGSIVFRMGDNINYVGGQFTHGLQHYYDIECPKLMVIHNEGCQTIHQFNLNGEKDNLSLFILEFGKLEKFDFIGLDKLCNSFVMKFGNCPGLNVQILLWGRKPLYKDGPLLNRVLIHNGGWYYFKESKESIMVFNDGQGLFIQHRDLFGELKTYPYDKYKELEAFL